MNPQAQFGPEHWQLLLILESAEVARARLDQTKLRVNRTTHPDRASSVHMPWNPEHGTVLADGTVLPDHDDWDCVDDLAASDLVRIGRDGYALTDAGWAIAVLARRYVAYHAHIDGFTPTPPQPLCPSGDPPFRPSLAEGAVTRDEPGHVDVTISPVLFCFRRGLSHVDEWEARGAITCAEGGSLSEAWLTAARDNAEELLRVTLAARAGEVTAPIEVLRCPDCQRLLHGSGPGGLSLLRSVSVAANGIECGPVHVVRYQDGVTILAHAGGRLELG